MEGKDVSENADDLCAKALFHIGGYRKTDNHTLICAHGCCGTEDFKYCCFKESTIVVAVIVTSMAAITVFVLVVNLLLKCKRRSRAPQTMSFVKTISDVHKSYPSPMVNPHWNTAYIGAPYSYITQVPVYPYPHLPDPYYPPSEGVHKMMHYPLTPV
ncbi:unnamed protein product [Lymnaea stagnalis]|uniref:Uncharacterized protein n=1 Tax=Lymnaea stagnalis TaxID=6523 RepID=A0AAV2HHG3_LYMST